VKKFIRISFFTLLFALVIFGASCKMCKKCGKNKNSKLTIEYWHANGAALTTVLEQIKASFEEKYPEYEVTLVSYGDYTTLRDTITGAIAGGVTPTAAQTYPDHVALYLQGKSLVALDKYINDPKYGMTKEEQAQFVEGFWNEGTIYDEAGTRYAMPFNKSTELMYYNADIFAKYKWNVPQTWDDVVSVAEAWKKTPEYTAAVQKYGQNQVFGMGYDSEANLFITLTQQYGATYTSFDANGKGVFNAFGAVEADTLK
jgi:multiple sugar transport system substrate-binding protein